MLEKSRTNDCPDKNLLAKTLRALLLLETCCFFFSTDVTDDVHEHGGNIQTAPIRIAKC